MSMNVPPEENPQAAAAPAEQQPAAPVEETPTAPEAAAPTEQVLPEQASPEQVVAKDQQVVDAVAQGLADEEITAEDIMTAVLSDALGISPQGAQSLFRLLMTELVDETQAPTDNVPPQEGV